jgi:hypothetical protein
MGLSLKKVTILMVLLLLIVGSSYMLLVFATPSIQQAPPGCPTYQVNLLVDLVDSSPINAMVGDTIVTRIHVVYQDGTPVTLSPELVSFVWIGGNGQKEFDNVPVVYTGTPGFYTYTQMITSDLIQATGQGKVTIWAVACSCSDGGGNRGPVSLVASDLTLTPSDNSNLAISSPASTSTSTTSTAMTQPVNYLVPLVVVLLLAIGLFLFLLRGRGKK